MMVLISLTSCNKVDSISSGDGEETTITITAQMPSAENRTRAVGDGTTVNRCIMEVYTSKGQLYKRMVQPVVGLNTTFELRLVSTQDFTFLFWADKVNNNSEPAINTDMIYDTQDLRAVKIRYQQYAINEENRDAFFACKTIKIDATTAMKVELKRPFGQVNVTTLLTDITLDDLKPDEVSVKYTTPIYTEFNLMTGEVSGLKTYGDSGRAAVYGVESENALPLSFDYLFAPATEKMLINFTMKFYKNGTQISSNDKFQMIPVQRNYRTNIKGELMTKHGIFNVEVVPDFEEGDINKDIVDVDASTSDEINAALSNKVKNTTNDGKTIGINIIKPISEVSTVTIPESMTVLNTPSINFNFTEAISNTLTIEEENSATNYGGELYITAPKSIEGDIVINMPKATVFVNGKLKNLNATVSPNTLIISENSEIETLTINQGNVKIKGTVEHLRFGENVSKVDSTIIAVTGKLNFCHNSTMDDVVPEMVFFTFHVTFEEMNYVYGQTPFGVKTILFTIKDDSANGSASEINQVFTSPINIDGFNKTISFTKGGGYTFKANATIKNLTINAANTIGKAPITVDQGNVTLISENLTIHQATSGNGDGTGSSGLGILVNGGSAINNVTIDLRNSTLNMNGPNGYQRAVVFPTSEVQKGMVVTMTNTTIKCLTTPTMRNANYSQGLGLALLDNPKITLKNCNFEGMYYAINNAGSSPTNMELTIDETNLSGYAALNLRGSSTINIMNGSVLTGCNYYPVGSNNFATIVYNQGEMKGTSSLKIDNSTIKNNLLNTSKEYLIDLRNNSGITVTLQNNTILEDGPKELGIALDHMIDGKMTGSSVIDDGTTKLIGKEGVKLHNTPIQ